MGQDLIHRAFRDHLAAVLARAGTQVDDPVGGADGLVVMLHDQHRVAQVAQALQGVQQAGVVARVQTDGRLVQDVQHTHQARADLRGQPDALRLAAGEGGRRALQGQIVQTHIDQEAQAGVDLFHNALRDRLLARGERRILACPDSCAQSRVYSTGQAVTSMMLTCRRR